jgi:hypothetical protein
MHLLGMLLGTEDDWPSALEQFLHRLDLKLNRFQGMENCKPTFLQLKSAGQGPGVMGGPGV